MKGSRITDDRLRGRLLQTIEKISTDLSKYELSLVRPNSLMSGLAGWAVFLAYAGRLLSDARYSNAAMAVCDELMVRMEGEIMPPGMHGIHGAAWAVDLAMKILGQHGADDTITPELDDLTLTYLQGAGTELHFDHVDGLVGLAALALHRPKRHQIVSTVVRLLRDRAEQQPTGLAWRTHSNQMIVGPSIEKAAEFANPGGVLNLGVAHGTPGVIGLLAYAIEDDCEAALAKELLSEACSWLFSVRDTSNTYASKFGYTTEKKRQSRAAWCYGDPGILSVLVRARRVAPSKIIRVMTEELAVALASRSTLMDEVAEVGLCHGAAGLAHMFSVSGRLLEDDALLDLSKAFAWRTVDLFEGGALSRIHSFAPDRLTDEMHRLGLFEGAVGVGLACIAALDSTCSEWDQLLMISPK